MIRQAMCASFKLELLQGIHDFTSDSFRMALYTSSATLDENTTVYTSSNEVLASGYIPGGSTLVTIAPQLFGNVGAVSFQNILWPLSTITARGCLIYNATKANRAVVVLDFGSDRVSNNSTFTVQFPVPFAGDTAIARIS